MSTLNNVPLKMLDWNEIIQMSRNNVTIGVHTLSHRNLQEINLEKAKCENSNRTAGNSFL